MSNKDFRVEHEGRGRENGKTESLFEAVAVRIGARGGGLLEGPLALSYTDIGAAHECPPNPL